MKLFEITWQHRNDFDGVLQCEHCESFQTMRYGYNDDRFHKLVIPAIKCINCGKRSIEKVPAIFVKKLKL
jgi:hypothetical protein